MPSNATYQIVPYVIKVNVGGSAEQRPIWNIDGNKASLHGFVQNTLAAAGGQVFVDPRDIHRKLEVKDLHVGARSLFFKLQPGRSGIASTIRRASGEEVVRSTGDTEYVPMRHALICPPGSSTALLLLERVAGNGAVTMLTRLLTGTFAAHHAGARLSVDAAMLAEALRKIIEKQPIKGIVFRRPRPGDGKAAYLNVAGLSAEMEVRYRPPRRASWRTGALPKGADGVVSRESMLGILAPQVMPNVPLETAQKALLEQGWVAELDVAFASGQRKVNVDTALGSTMSFPVLDPDTDRGDHEPTDEEFKSACKSVLQTFAEEQWLTSDTMDLCDWSSSTFAADKDADWKVVWDDPTSSSPTSS